MRTYTAILVSGAGFLTIQQMARMTQLWLIYGAMIDPRTRCPVAQDVIRNDMGEHLAVQGSSLKMQ